MASQNFLLPDRSGTLALEEDFAGKFLRLNGTANGEYIEGNIQVVNGENIKFFTSDGDSGAEIFWTASANNVGLQSTDVLQGEVRFELINGRAVYSSSAPSGSILQEGVAGNGGGSGGQVIDQPFLRNY